MAFIDAQEVKLQVMLSNAQEAYKVPLYQRPYAWTRDQWEDLFEDLNSLERSDVHFLGSLVVVPEGEHRLGVNYFQIVDGQQRLATILIWLSAIRDLAKDNGNSELATHLTETFLFARGWESGKQKRIPKLQLGQLDNDAFQRVIEGNPEDYSHLIFECYEYFKERTDNENTWQILLNNVSIVHINARNHFNAFRLFETLNDRGLELSAADLIKNFLLMKVSSDGEMFNDAINQWNEMYEKVRNKEPVKFIRRYFLSNYKGRVSEYRLYEGVRQRLEKESLKDICEFVKDLNRNASVYKKIYECSFSERVINSKLQELHLVEVAPSFTLFLKIMHYFEGKEIKKEDILEIMEMIESFHIRWGICRQSTSRLDQIYNDICLELKDKRPEDFKAIIRDRLHRELENSADDEIFKRSFSQRSFRPNDNRTKYILWRLSRPTGETTLNLSEIHTEHILPQTLSSNWVKYLEQKTSKSEAEITALHRENINRIGNLTLIKGEWNIRMSNRLFDEKKADYAKSELQITRSLSNYSDWTFEKINERSIWLAKEACNIWKIN